MKVVWGPPICSSYPSLIFKGYDIELVITQQDKPKEREKYFYSYKESSRLGLEVFQPISINSPESIEKFRL